MKLKDIEKLEQADQLMFELSESTDPKANLLKVGQILKEVGMLDDKTNLANIIKTYNQDIESNFKKAHRKEMATIVSFHPQSLKTYLKSDDEVEASLARECLDNFKKYGQIVLRFKEKKAAWQEEKSGEEFRRLFGNLDSKRTMIHNDCISDIAALNRLICLGSPSQGEFATWDNKNIKEVTDIPRSDIGNAIIKLFCDELVQNNFNILKKITVNKKTIS